MGMPVVGAVQFGALTHQSVRTCPIQAHAIVDSPACCAAIDHGSGSMTFDFVAAVAL
jgi:hypothetical protein